MDNSGQLTFSDDPLLNASNDVFLLIEEGRFTEGVEILNKILSMNPDYPGVIECYRTAKFWKNREDELAKTAEGIKKAEYLMNEWAIFDKYAKSKSMDTSTAYIAATKYIFFSASENYKTAFKNQEDTVNNFELLLNLGDCFLRLKEYKNAIDTLEYARSLYNGNARLLSILGEANYHLKDYTKSLLYFKEAFFINASEIDLEHVEAKPIKDLVAIIDQEMKEYNDVREWIPVFGFLKDVFYVRRNLDKHQVETIKKEIFTLEKNFQRMDSEQILNSNVQPRLINKYLWLYDYYEIQNHKIDNINEIKKRILEIGEDLFKDYFDRKK